MNQDQLSYLRTLSKIIFEHDKAFITANEGVVSKNFEGRPYLYIDLISKYGSYIYTTFELSFSYEKIEVNQTASANLNRCLETLSKLSNIYHLDKWDIVHNYLIEALAPETPFRKEKEDWILKILDSKTSYRLKEYIRLMSLSF